MFPPGRPPDRVLDFIIKIKEISGLKDVEMQSQYDDKTIMIRVVKHQHGGISLRSVWDPRITVFDKLTTDTDGFLVYIDLIVGRMSLRRRLLSVVMKNLVIATHIFVL